MSSDGNCRRNWSGNDSSIECFLVGGCFLFFFKYLTLVVTLVEIESTFKDSLRGFSLVFFFFSWPFSLSLSLFLFSLSLSLFFSPSFLSGYLFDFFSWVAARFQMENQWKTNGKALVYKTRQTDIRN